jgi:hypothetical protein
MASIGRDRLAPPPLFCVSLDTAPSRAGSTAPVISVLRSAPCRVLIALVTVLAALAGAWLTDAPAATRATEARSVQVVVHTAAVNRAQRRCRSSLTVVRMNSVRGFAASPRVRNRYGTRMFGIAAGGSLQTEPAAEMRSDVANDARTGARWVRIDINWAQVQTQGPHGYFWRQLNRVVRRARTCGMHVLGTIIYAPTWAQRGDEPGTDPPKPRLYARFAAAAARHFRHRGVRAFEIWNEPNTQIFWEPRPNPRAYTRLLRLSYRAIKHANPHAIVVSGGLAPARNTPTTINARRFLKAMYRHGARNHFNALGYHPYSWPVFPGVRLRGNAWFQMNGTQTSLRSIMRAHHDGAKKIWGTEFGAPTWGPTGTFVSLDQQAGMIRRGYRLWSGYRWAGPLFTYQGRDEGFDASTNEDFFGLIKYNGVPKPAFWAFQRATLTVADDEAAQKERVVAASARHHRRHRRS